MFMSLTIIGFRDSLNIMRFTGIFSSVTNFEHNFIS